AIDLQIEIAALAELGELLVLVAKLLNGANAEPLMLGADRPVELPKLEVQVVQAGCAHGVRPPQIRFVDGQLRELVWGEADLALLACSQGDRLLDLEVGLA